MARKRPKQLEPSKIGHSKFGFDGEEDGCVFVKKQRVIIILPSLPVTRHSTLEKPATTSQSQAELRDNIVDTQESTFLHTVVPSLPLPEHFILQKPETTQSQVDLREVIADTHETTLAHTVLPSLHVPEEILQKPETFQSQVEFRDCIVHETIPLHAVVPSLPVTEHFTLHKPATTQSEAAELSDFTVDTRESTHIHTVVPSLPLPEQYSMQKPATSQSQAELRLDSHQGSLVYTVVPSISGPRHCTSQKVATSQSQAELTVSIADTHKTTLVHAMVPALPGTEDFTLQRPVASQSQAESKELVADTHVHTVEPEACPDFTSVDKPEIITGRNRTTRKAPARAPRRSLQDCRMNPDRRVEIHKSRIGHKPIRFPRVMCSSVVMDNEKLRVLNLERKIEKAGGLNEWVGSIGLGREFERLLRGQRMSKFEMANLTMEKLKHMGALAVGPRRKLIHAICCAYHPHCLRASLIREQATEI